MTTRLGAFVGIILILFTQAGAATALKRCNEALIGSVQMESVDDSIRDLSRLRLNLDRARASGSQSLVITALTADYKKRQSRGIEANAGGL